MSFESFIARRYLRAKRKVSLITIIAAISVCGIAIGVAALVCVLSVFNGFNGIVKSLLVGFDPHLRITPIEGTIAQPDSLLAVVKKQPEVIAAAPFVSGRSAIIHEQGLKVIQIRGMRHEDITTAVGLGERIINGSLPAPNDRIPHPIVLGTLLAYQLHSSIGDTISLLSQSGLEESLTQLVQPNIVPCVVTGVFESSNKEYDNYYAYTDLETARDLFALETGVAGIEIRLRDLERAEELAVSMRPLLGPRYRIETWQDLHRDLFAVMELERWAAFIILSLIIVVAVFNVLGSLAMTVIEKQRDIGILKTMGASDKSIQRIFILEGGLIGIIGTVAGTLIGIALVLVQQEYGIFKLDSAVYIIPALPVQLRISDLLIICGTALIMSFGAAIYPSRRAARVLPAEAVRWE
jgi:lipoprotein-releasing system permease protein